MSRLGSRGGVMVTQNRIVSLVNSTIRPVLFMLGLVLAIVRLGDFLTDDD